MNMRPEDGYCGRQSAYVNYFDEAKPCFVSREDVEATIASAPVLKRKPGTKVCKKCGRELPLDQFPLHPHSRDGHNNTCRECFASRMREVQLERAAKKPKKAKPVKVREDLPEGMKRCKRCGQVKPVTEFGRHKNTFDHLHPCCNDCRREQGRAAYEKKCAALGVKPVPAKSADTQIPQPAGKKYAPLTIRELSDQDLVKELRYRGWTVTCTKEI